MNKTEHALNHISEECSEIIQRISKSMRFGLDDIQPGQSLNNRQRLRAEIIDFIGAVDVAIDAGILDVGLWMDIDGVEAKREKIKKYMARSEACGTIT